LVPRANAGRFALRRDRRSVFLNRRRNWRD